jgi:hypothetical protein
MKNHIFKNIVISRLDLTTYNKIKEDIKEKLENYIDIEYLFDIPEKKFFSNLNILYKLKNNNYIIKTLITDIFNPNEIIINDNILSFSYQSENIFYSEYYRQDVKTIVYYQINLIKVKNLKMSKFYFSYGDFSNIVNEILNTYDLYFNIQGLFIKLYNSKEIMLFENPIDICTYIGVNYNNWLNFKSSEEIFHFICSIKFFNKKIFYNNINYENNKKMYHNFLNYIKKLKN